MMLWDAGIQLYANPYYTTDRMLDENGDKITAAIRAISRGWGCVHATQKRAWMLWSNGIPTSTKQVR